MTIEHFEDFETRTVKSRQSGVKALDHGRWALEGSHENRVL